MYRGERVWHQGGWNFLTAQTVQRWTLLQMGVWVCWCLTYPRVTETLLHVLQPQTGDWTSLKFLSKPKFSKFHKLSWTGSCLKGGTPCHTFFGKANAPLTMGRLTDSQTCWENLLPHFPWAGPSQGLSTAAKTLKQASSGGKGLFWGVIFSWGLSNDLAKPW